MLSQHALIPALLAICAALALGSENPPTAATGETGGPYVIFLGTGAADIKSPKTDSCPNCTYVREHGGRNRRRFSSLFVSPDVVVDYATTGRESMRDARVEPAKVNWLLITHSHGDHFSPSSIVELAGERIKSAKGELTLLGNATAAKMMREHLASLKEPPPIKAREVRPYEEFTAGEWRCKALPANHDPGEDCLVYVLRCGEKSLFYATDTTWFPVGTFNALKAEKLDLAIVEGTFGELTDPAYLAGHMTFAFDRLVKEFLVGQHAMKPSGKFALTHLSLHWCEPYDKLAPKLAKEGILVPYDGLRIGL